jgi:hypothetical protein
MRYFISTLMTLIIMSMTAFGQAPITVQYQAHANQSNGTAVRFSAYIANETFNETSRLNRDAFWFVEDTLVEVHNGMINIDLADIPFTAFAPSSGTTREGNIFVYSYINNQPVGRLPINALPYARIASHAISANHAQTARTASRATIADTANVALVAVLATNAENARVATIANSATIADVAVVARQSVYSQTADTAGYAFNAGHAGTATSATVSDYATIAETVIPNTITTESIWGGQSAPIGAFPRKGVSGLEWVSNPCNTSTMVEIHTIIPLFINGHTTRYLVSRVAQDYSLVAPTTPTQNQLLTVYNGATANTVTLNAMTWNIDTGISITLNPSQSSTLWFDGSSWVVVQ